MTWILQLLPTAFTNLNWLDQNNPCWKTWNDRPFLVATIILLFKVLLFHQQLWIENLLKTRCKDIYKDPGRFSILLNFLTMKRCKYLPWNFGEYWGMQATGLWTRWQSVLQWGKKGMTLYFIKLYKNGIILKIWNINKKICKHDIVRVIIILTSLTECRF